MFSLMDLRALLEQGFAPLACDCVLGDASLSVRVYDRESGRVDLMVAGIALGGLRQREDAVRLLKELQDELAFNALRRAQS
ncbi:Protein of unknown function (DUF1652) [Pseudomonas asplenii]|uniref:DUF1652 domain-containing protein n=2 Tax=Pseudomonas TaxID=286 RepID=A0A0M9GC72_9PSED|nr:Protein of unknown function (DUF1652) [Pseudomonas fuscovaginae]KPA99374.1 Protein of unknown function (DUF1652) [Pseudomonas fuscovaginae]